MLEQGSKIVGCPVGLRASVEANVVGSEGPVAREIPRCHGGGDVESSRDVRAGHLAEEVEPEVNMGETLPLSPSRLVNVRFQRILAVVICISDSTFVASRLHTCSSF